MYYISQGPHEMHSGTITGFSSRSVKEEEEAHKAYGAYHKIVRPRWPEVFFFMTCVGTLMSLVYYFRVFLPIPDQVAGGNVIKDLRTEARSSTTGSKKSSRTVKDNQDSAWPERSRPIATENRFRLSFRVRVIRMIEALFVCSILPRTKYICRATGHCPEGAQVWELTRILYPTGISTPLRRDGNVTLGSMESDRFSALLTAVSIVLVSYYLLVGENAVLNKTYLAIMAYVSNEWNLVENPDLSLPPPVWDPRRRYKKGDLILFPPSGPRQSVYRATANNPEGKPSNLQMRIEQDLFCKELGHPATSSMLSSLSALQWANAALHMVLLILCKLFLGLHAGTWLSTALFAHLVAAYALVSIGVSNYSRLGRLNAEIGSTA
jgi:hypothetical protein